MLPAAIALTACLAQAAMAAALDEAAARGKQIYFSGTSARGSDINAVVGAEATVLPAMALPCVNCHGYDGLGRPEGGVVPTDIRWSQLVKNYGHVHQHGRRHGPFDRESLGRSIISGVDPAGNRLDRSMPTYLMSKDDLADLVAYLEVLEEDFDPGISASHISIASLLPVEGRMADLGHAMEAALKARVDELNASGGVFNRQVELVTVPRGDTTEATLDNLEAAFSNQGLFALVSGYTIGLEAPLLDRLRRDNVPLVGPFTLDPGDAYLDATVFYLYPGFAEMVRALAATALEETGATGKVLVVAPADGRHDRLERAARQQLGDKAASSRYETGSVSSLVDEIRNSGTRSIIFLGEQQDLDALLASLDSASLAPSIYVLSSHLAEVPVDAPRAFDRRIFVAFPTLSADISQKGRTHYLALAERYSLPTGHVQAQAAALAAMEVFIEGLRRAGRDLSRRRLVDGIEALYNYDTGFTPPLVYGPNHRIGALGAHILVLDLQSGRYVADGPSWRVLR